MSQFSRIYCTAAFGLFMVFFVSSSLIAQSDFTRGDLNDDGGINIADGQSVLNCLFGIAGGRCPTCMDTADTNDDGGFNIADAQYLYNFIFLGGSAPPAPFGGCGQDPTPDGIGCGSYNSCGPSSLSFELDPSVVPNTTELPGFDGGMRPVAALVDDNGFRTEFVENELSIRSDDVREVEAFIDRWNGEILAKYDPKLLELPFDVEYLVRVNVSRANTSRLTQHLQKMGAEDAGRYRVSSDLGHKLLAVSAMEAASGLDVAVNWVGQYDMSPQFIDGRSMESATGPSPSGGCDSGGLPCEAYNQDAYNWSSHNADELPATGVAEAWQILERNGRLHPGDVGIAILDAGFRPDWDLVHNGFILGHWIASSPLPLDPTVAENLGSCGGSDCRFHGTNVTSAAMAVPDNDFGSAGPGGPVAQPYLIYSTLDRFTTWLALDEAVYWGARVVNISYSIWGPSPWAWEQRLTSDFDAIVRGLRSRGILFFSSAGNNNEDVGIDIVHYWPCENEGVICVGGLGWQSESKAMNSNYGGGVDIYAPYFQIIGPDPENPTGAQFIAGTSFSSPYTAGVAALVFAANPALTPDEVEDILIETANPSPDPQVNRYVNAMDAVVDGLLSTGMDDFRMEIVSPRDGASYPAGSVSVSLGVDAWDVVDGVPSVTWRSNLEGRIGQSGPSHVFREVGTHTITATATNSRGDVLRDRVTITIVSDPPTVTITNPTAGSTFTRSQAIDLQAETFDINDLSVLAEGNVEWFLDGNFLSRIATGHSSGLIPGGTLSLGTHTINLRGTDSDGTVAFDSVTINVIEDPVANQPPSVVVISPASNQRFLPNQYDSVAELWYASVTLCAHGIDPEEGRLEGDNVQFWIKERDGDIWFPAGGDTGPGTCPVKRFFLRDPYETVYDIWVRVTDSDGASSDRTLSITVYGLF